MGDIQIAWIVRSTISDTDDAVERHAAGVLDVMVD
jgi:hypothetical protein